METFGPDKSVLVVVIASLLLVLVGLGKKQLTWKRPKPRPIRSRRRGR